MSAPFDCDSTSLSGCKLLEASAGTGKTYSLERIVSRLIVGDGGKPLRIGEILIVTFTKAATAELSVRIRASISTLANACEAMCRGKMPENANDVALLRRWEKEGLYDAKVDVLNLAQKRLRAALNEYDDAAISTIHGFCQKALERYAFTRAGDYGLRLASEVEIKALRDQVRDECLERLPMDSSPKSQTVRKVILQIRDWDALFASLERETRSDRKKLERLLPEGFCGSEAAFQWFKENFALWAVDRLSSLKKAKHLTTFDDMLLDLREAVHSARGGSLVAAVRKEFKAVLIDEFQDTDPVQYDIFRTFFLAQETQARPQTLIFVGDPKQAIYSFRSAEIETYLQARREIGGEDGACVYSLNRNFRSCPVIVDAVNTLFSREGLTPLGEPRNPFLMSEASACETMDVRSESCDERLPLLFLEKGTGFVWKEPGFECWRFEKKSLEEAGVDDIELIAADIARLLSGKHYLTSGEEREGVYGTVTRQGDFKPLEPSDIAILVRTRSRAEDILHVLRRHGIAAGVQSDESVFACESAKDLARILLALETPENKNALSQAMATNLVGADCESLREDASRGFIRQALEKAKQEVYSLGIYASITHLIRNPGKAFSGRLLNTEARLLRRADGERLLADYLEVLETLQQTQRMLPSLAALRNWLLQQIALAGQKLETTPLRVETDRSLVHVVTIHSSKGLQYPVVYLYGVASMVLGNRDPERRYVFRESDGITRHLKVECPKCDRFSHRLAKPTPDNPSHEVFPTLLREEQENIRLLYVAMTRAANRLVIPVVRSTKEIFKSALLESMFGHGQTGVYDAEKGHYVGALEQQPTEEMYEAAFTTWERELKARGDTVKEQGNRRIQSYLTQSGHLFSTFGQPQGKALSLVPDSPEFLFERIPQSLLEHPGKIEETRVPALVLAKAQPLPRRWTQTSFSAINEVLDEPYALSHSDFYGFPAGPEAGTFLHESIEKAVLEGIRRFKGSQQSHDAFCAWLDDFLTHEFEHSLVKKTLPCSAEGVSYDEAVLKILGLASHGLMPRDYAKCWFIRVMQDAFTTSLTDKTPQTLESLIRRGHVATEVDFLQLTTNLASSTWSAQSLVEALTHLGIENLRFTALTDEQCRDMGRKCAARALDGYLTGQIDILMMTGDRRAGTEMYWVLDWKSNKIEEQTHSRDYAGNYCSENIEAVMNACNYKLQGLLYLTALRRYLASRYPTQEQADCHIGGAVYVFLRGLLGVNMPGALRHGFFNMPYAQYHEAVERIDAIFRGEDR